MLRLDYDYMVEDKYQFSQVALVTLLESETFIYMKFRLIKIKTLLVQLQSTSKKKKKGQTRSVKIVNIYMSGELYVRVPCLQHFKV